jgi:hypothetical protein
MSSDVWGLHVGMDGLPIGKITDEMDGKGRGVWRGVRTGKRPGGCTSRSITEWAPGVETAAARDEII